jgi:hypothetical protein
VFVAGGCFIDDAKAMILQAGADLFQSKPQCKETNENLYLIAFSARNPRFYFPNTSCSNEVSCTCHNTNITECHAVVSS